MNKKWIYLLLITIVTLVVYFGSYRYFYNSSKLPEKEEMPTATEALQDVVSIAKETVDTHTQMIMEYYDAVHDRTSFEYLKQNTEYLGLDRDGLITYIKTYMKNPPLEEVEEGLYEFEVISFSAEQVRLRKSYKKEAKKAKYYVGLRDNMVVVYFNDDARTVFEETGIDARALPDNIATKLSDGMFFQDDYDLYNFLEAYSS